MARYGTTVYIRNPVTGLWRATLGTKNPIYLEG